MTCAVGWILLAAGSAQGATAGTDADQPLVIAADGETEAIICVDTAAGDEGERAWERRAADDLAKFIEMISGARPAIADTPEAIEAALNSDAPLLIVGELALREAPRLREALAAVAKKDPVLRADAMVMRRDGNRVYLAGTNDDSHYYAAVALLRDWGSRWFMPTEFGQVIPVHEKLAIGQLDRAYAPPFEVRTFWLSWHGSQEGYEEFLHRNFMNDAHPVVAGHRLAKYVQDLVPEGGSAFNVPISDPKTAKHVAEQVAEQYAAGKNIALGMEDGVYRSDYPRDEKLKAGIFDKYYMLPSMTEPFMVFYNQVAEILQREYPKSDAKIGFLAYTNLTIPPQRDFVAAEPLVALLAPIDIDPIHGMDSPLSPPRQEFREMMYRWAQVMQGRVILYDYDQGMLVWRDIPAPSHQAFVRDVKHYRDAGILGVQTESRGAYATTFTNLYLRGQLMWNPDADVEALLADFFQRFYGPAAEPMSRYWQTIFDAWANTLSTEHEYFIAPAIYTPELVDQLRSYLAQAEQQVASLRDKSNLSRNEQLYLDRMHFTQMSFNMIDQYMSMVWAGARHGDYAEAADIGRQVMATRLELARLNPTFTTRVIGRAADPKDPGGRAAWLPGEVQQYIDLAELTDGTRGVLVQKLPLKWAFRRDPHDTGLVRGWARKPVDLSYWKQHGQDLSSRERKDYPSTEWGMIRTDLYTQAQGIRHPDGQTFNGYMWYRTDFELSEAESGDALHVKFPGLFGETWLYINGYLVAHREQNPVWWYNDYRFEWDADLTGHVQPGRNTISLRIHVPHHLGGMFRRPFLYQPTKMAQ